MSDIQTQNSQLSDQNILLKAQLTASSGTSNQIQLDQRTDNSNNVSEYENTISNLQQQIHSLKHESTRISFYESENTRLLKEIDSLRIETNTSEIDKLKKDQEDLLELLSEQV